LHGYIGRLRPNPVLQQPGDRPVTTRALKRHHIPGDTEIMRLTGPRRRTVSRQHAAVRLGTLSFCGLPVGNSFAAFATGNVAQL
jgi:hypothetical protein